MEPITLREIAKAMEGHLNAIADHAHDVHWIAVTGEDSMRAPAKLWTQAMADSLLMVGVRDGNSEGMLLYVRALPNRYRPDEGQTLFTVKLLSGHDQSFLAAKDLSRFLRSSEFESMVEGRAAPSPTTAPEKAPSPTSTNRTSGPDTAAQRCALAIRFIDELAASVESMAAIGDQHGPQTLTDLMYVQRAIVADDYIHAYPSHSAAAQIVSEMPSAAIWMKYVRVIEDEALSLRQHQAA